MVSGNLYIHTLPISSMSDKKKPEYIRVRLKKTTVEKLRTLSDNKNVGKIGCKITLDNVINDAINVLLDYMKLLN